MNLSSTSLQIVLSKILFGDKWEENLKYVVHRQGNLMNPQQLFDCSAYFTFYISNTKRTTLNIADNNYHIANVIRTIELQCIGLKAEEFMLSTLFWDERSDIRKLLDEYNSILLESPRNIASMPYFQDGANTLLSYETTLKISSSIVLEEEWEDMPELELKGSLKGSLIYPEEN